MFFEKKKKVFSEVSDANKNINSDWFDIFQNEFKNMFNPNDPNYSDSTKIEKSQKPETNNNLKSIELEEQDIFYIQIFSQYIKNNKK